MGEENKWDEKKKKKKTTGTTYTFYFVCHTVITFTPHRKPVRVGEVYPLESCSEQAVVRGVVAPPPSPVRAFFWCRT